MSGSESGEGSTENERSDRSNGGLARRSVVAAAGVWALAACSDSGKSGSSGGSSQQGKASGAARPVGKLIGDGSMSDTGPQPHQPKAEKLKAGDTPPQFVVISWDGAAELTSNPLLTRFRKVAQETNASMTLFLSGLYFLPEHKRNLYHGPHHAVGASDINFLTEGSVRGTIKGIGQAWSEGHEIGTHFNGHFCGPTGVGRWSAADWHSEIRQAHSYVANWRTNTGFTDLPPLPFDYRKELVGGRTPCLEGGDNLRTAAHELGWRYDTSKTATQMWPRKDKGMWDLSLQSIPFPGHSFSVLSMDYNMMFNQSGTTKGAASRRQTWRKQAGDAYLAGLERAHGSNRAPLVIGNHFETWNGGIYMDAVEDTMRKVAKYPDTRMVSFRQLCDWLDAQDPAVIKKLQALPVGHKPPGGWDEYLELT